MPVEAHNSISLVRAMPRTTKACVQHSGIRNYPTFLREERLQMAIKAVNDTAGPDGIVPSL